MHLHYTVYRILLVQPQNPNANSFWPRAVMRKSYLLACLLAVVRRVRR